MNGAPIPSRNLIVSIPRQITIMLMAQKRKKQIQLLPEDLLRRAIRFATSSRWLARQSMPGCRTSQQATSARKIAGIFRSAHAKRCAHEYGKRDAVTRARVRIQEHGNQHNQIPQKYGEHRLNPTHPACNQGRMPTCTSECKRSWPPRATHNCRCPRSVCPGESGPSQDCRETRRPVVSSILCPWKIGMRRQPIASVSRMPLLERVTLRKC